MHDQITQGLYTFHADYWKDVSEEAVDLVKRLLTVCPEDRVTVEGVLEHPWMQDQAVITRVRGLMKDEIAKLSMSPPSLPVSQPLSSLRKDIVMYNLMPLYPAISPTSTCYVSVSTQWDVDTECVFP